MKNEKTVGEKANELAKKYFEFYKQWKKEGRFENDDKRRRMAQYDFVVRKLIFDFAIVELDKMIDEFEGDQKCQ